MKTKIFLTLLAASSIPLLALTSRADDFNAVQNGNWSDPNTWSDNTVATNGIVPGAADSADIPTGITVTVDTNESVGYVYDSGTLIMGTNSSLNVFNDSAIVSTVNFITTNYGNTVIYSCNPFSAKACNYYNLILANTNWPGQTNANSSSPPPYQNFNNFNSTGAGGVPTPMNIAGNFILMGAIAVQQGTDGPGVSTDITIGGNLIIGVGCRWDSSGANLMVASNAYVYGVLEDLNGALGSNYIGGNVIVPPPSTHYFTWTSGPFNSGIYTNGWHVSDVTAWYVNGSLTNNGVIWGNGFGSISFTGSGAIAGSNALTIPTMTVSGTYAIQDSITLITNTPTLLGTLVFDLTRTNMITLRYAPTTWGTNTTLTNYYSGNLVIVNSGPAPVSGNVYKFFSASNYAGTFTTTTYPPLTPGLSWGDNSLVNGSYAVTGAALGSPALTISRSSVMLTLSWDSTTYPGYQVVAQTNSGGLHPTSGWSPVGSGTVSPYMTTINPASPTVFYKLSNP
jgi:hypothetical protein